MIIVPADNVTLVVVSEITTDVYSEVFEVGYANFVDWTLNVEVQFSSSMPPLPTLDVSLEGSMDRNQWYGISQITGVGGPGLQRATADLTAVFIRYFYHLQLDPPIPGIVGYSTFDVHANLTKTPD